jgi:acyl-[acyl-carrier-protein]-phospholipid O-acyltransferase / long-chain-fatty-acid--[acyl-carrier-protein] ligase
MLFLPKKKSRFFIRRILDKRNSFIKSDNFSSTHALNFLNIAQFLGVINDNVFKFLTVFLLIDIKGIAASSSILFWVGTVYVLPFLLFSSAAGVVADKFSKQKIIVILKALEVVTTALAVLAFSLQSAWACYVLLFLLSFHSAAFGPPKYSIIPEIVPSDKISKANGIVTSFTYLGIIVGTFLASFTTQITSRNFTLASCVCVLIAVLGLAASLLIPYTKPTRTTTRIKFFFLKEIYNTLSFCYKSPHLLLAILSSAFFLYLGAFFQLNIIPFAMQALNLSEVGGGYLFLTVAVGIAIGAVLVGKLSKHRIELGFSCIASFALFALVLFLAILPKTLKLDVVLLVLIGCCSGFFIVPFDAYIQKHSPDARRGQVVATSNFMSFCGVLLAPFSIYVLSGSYRLTAAQGFFFISLFVFAVSLIILFKLSHLLLNCLGRIFLPLFYKVVFLHSPWEKSSCPLLIMPHSSLKKACLLAGHHDHLHFFILRDTFKLRDIFYKLCSCVDVLYIHSLSKPIHQVLEQEVKQGKTSCLCIDSTLEKFPPQRTVISAFPSLYMHVNQTDEKQIKTLGKKEIVISFSESP